jgi:hypothetical protein
MLVCNEKNLAKSLSRQMLRLGNDLINTRFWGHQLSKALKPPAISSEPDYPRSRKTTSGQFHGAVQRSQWKSSGHMYRKSGARYVPDAALH